MKILAIDDEDKNLLLLSRILGKQHELVTEATCTDGIARLQKGERFDIIITDNETPGGKTGVDVVEAALGLAIPIPVVMLTGRPEEAREQADLRGITNFVLVGKPYSPRELSGYIEEAMAISTQKAP